LKFQPSNIENYNSAFSELLQTDPREDFLTYLDEKIFFQQRYNDFKTSDTQVKSKGHGEEERKAAVFEKEEKKAPVFEEAADAAEEEKKEVVEEEKNETFRDAIKSKVGKIAFDRLKISKFGKIQAKNCEQSSDEVCIDQDKVFSSTSRGGSSFREVVHLLRQSMEKNLISREGEMLFQVKYFANIQENAEDVPLVFLVRLVETKTGHQMLTFTNVSLVCLSAQK